MRIYLAGPINGCTDAEANDWRTEARRLLVDHEIVDPMVRDYRGKESENVADIVEGDLRDIASCDVVLVNAHRPSWGTAMEVRAAKHELQKRVVAFAPAPQSPWLAHHAECFPSLASAAAHIRAIATVVDLEQAIEEIRYYQQRRNHRPSPPLSSGAQE